MRNLKKFLALVLAMMMVFSLMVTVNAASAAPDYQGAYDTLKRYGVFEGVEGGADSLGTKFSRAQMATVAYRIATGDTEGKQLDLYVGYSARFSDVPEDAWYAGAVGFCANYGIVVGYGDGRFDPNKQVTGVQAAAMMLRLLGWGQNHEYEGTNWDYRVAGQAERVGILRNITSDDLFGLANRGLAAGLTYNAVTYPWQVSYGNNTYTQNGPHLITATASTPVTTTDNWGAITTTTTTTVSYNWNYWGTTTKTLTDTEDGALYTFYGPMTQCDLADEISLTRGVNFDTFTNGIGNYAQEYIDPFNTVTFVGAQGRVTSVYDADGNGTPDRLVYKDVVLAEVGTRAGGFIDTGDHEVAGATAYGATVYGNTVMEGLPPITGVPGTYNYVKNTSTVYTVAGDFTTGQYIAAYILTGTVNNNIDSGTLPYNPSTGVPYSSAPVRLDAVQNVDPVQVTVNGIIYDANTSGKEIVGFKDTAGVEYLYDVSFGYNTNDATFVAYDNGQGATGSVQVLDNTAIKKTFNVYYWTAPDGTRNVLGIEPVTTADQYGVVTAEKAVVVENPNSVAQIYAIEYTVLMPDGTYSNFRTVQAGGQLYAATDLGTVKSLLRKLVKIEVNTNNRTYNTLTPALQDVAPSVGGPGQDNVNAKVYAYDADTLANGVLVNNNTVFFMAKYVMNNANDVQGAYSTNGYEIINGFQAANFINDYAYGYSTKGIYENGQEIKGYDTNGDYNQTINSLDVYAYAADGTVVAAGSGKTAKYVLVLNATERTPITERAQNTSNYAYVVSALNQSTVYDDYYQFNVLRNGTPGTLDLNNAAGQYVATNGSGLYIYKPDSTNGYNSIEGTNKVNRVYNAGSGAWVYSAGVLTVLQGTPVNPNGLTTLPAGWNNKFLTVIDNVPICIVNQSTGKVYPTTYSLSTLANYYTELYYQVDAYGRVNFVYVVDKDVFGNTPGTPATTYTVTLTLHIVNPFTGADIGSPYTVTVSQPNGTYTVTVNEIAARRGLSTTGLQAFGPASATYTVSGGATSAPDLYAYYNYN